jgi:Ca2+-binding EF-hand superfamily protein
MVSFAELQRGLETICPISQPVLEQLYALMDHQRIGLVSYDAFLAVLKNQQFEAPKITDNFDWENSMIQKIRGWIADKRYTVEEAFKCFDKDFDGYISKVDLKQSLTTLIEVPAAEIHATKLDRLYRLMDFFKQGQIQLSDFTRLLTPANPYATTAVSGAANKMSRSLGGGLEKTSTFDWKFSAVQQLGLVCSKKYATTKACFAAVSGGKNSVNFSDFHSFVEQNNALEGFNLTMPLMQKLFAELDAHKKGHLNFNDWNSAFNAFKMSDQILVELKNILQTSFADSESAFNFFLTFNEAGKKAKNSVPQDAFNQAVKSLTSGRFKPKEIAELWQSLISGKSNGLDVHAFRSHFDSLAYTGKAQIKTIKALAGSSINSSNAPMRGASSAKAGRTTIQTATSSSENWEHNVMEKLKQIIKSSSMNLRQIFNSMDVDGNGFITQVEFRNAVRQLGLGLTSREID